MERSKATSTEYILRELCRYKIGTYADIIYRNGLLYPDREAFVYGSERVTFAEYNTRVNSLIHALWSMGVKKGDVTGVLSWNCLDYVDVYGAAMKVWRELPGFWRKFGLMEQGSNSEAGHPLSLD